MENTEKYLYKEKISSSKTELLFIVMATLFTSLLIWRTNLFTRWDSLAAVFLSLACFFLFYCVNYHTLLILITPEQVLLRFGIFKWTVPIDTIRQVQLDEIPPFLKYGGAGIHFMTVGKRYRASFNFLEYARTCISLKKKRGLVQDVSFTTREPEEVISVLSRIMKDIKS